MSAKVRQELDPEEYAELVRLGELPVDQLREKAYDYVSDSATKMKQSRVWTRGQLIALLFDEFLKGRRHGTLGGNNYAAWRRIALEQGYAMVKLSARRYTVIKLRDSAGAKNAGNNTFYTHLDGDIVFGPRTYEDCSLFLHQTLPRLPQGLNPR